MHGEPIFSATIGFIGTTNNFQTKLSPSDVVAMTTIYGNFSLKLTMK